MNSARHVLFACAVLCCGVGCTAINRGTRSLVDLSSAGDVTIVQGRPNRIADGVGYALGLPERFLTLHPSVNNHEFSDETRDTLVSYLKKNNLSDVYVRVNQYDPVGEWRRLRENRHVAPGWKYTIGLLSMTTYTLIPGRIFGGDLYNPFTNSLYINSDISAVALHEAAYAKDVREQQLPGTYAAINEVPFVSLWRHVRGVNDVVEYAQREDDWNMECETYRVVYPMIGIHLASGGLHSVVGNEPLEGMLFTPLLPIGGALAGHAAGELAVMRRHHQMTRESREEDPDATLQWHRSRDASPLEP